MSVDKDRKNVDKYGYFNVWDLKLERFPSPADVVVISWREEAESGSALVRKAASNADQYDAVIEEFTAKLAIIYRPNQE